MQQVVSVTVSTLNQVNVLFCLPRYLATQSGYRRKKWTVWKIGAQRRFDGWQKNRRGRLLIPKRTGIGTVQGSIESGQGWASLGTRSPSEVSLDGESEAHRELSADLSLPGSSAPRRTLCASHERQQSLP